MGSTSEAVRLERAGSGGAGTRSPYPGRFGTRLCLLLVLVGVPALGLTIYGNFRERGLEKARLKEGSLALASLAAANQENLIRNVRQLFTTLNQFPFLLLATNRAFSEGNFSNLRKLLPDYATFGLIETNGAAFCGAEPLTHDVYLGDRSYFQRALQTKQFATGDFQIGRLSGQAVLDFGFPVLNERGQVGRILFASLKASRMAEVVQDLRLPEGAALTVMDRAGTVLARLPESAQWLGRRHPEASLLTAGLTNRSGLFETQGPDGLARIYAVKAVGASPAPGLLVCVEVPMSVLFAHANHELYQRLGALSLLALVLCVAVQLYARRSFLAPVKALSLAAERLANGELGARAGTVAGAAAELNQLGRTLDAMAQRVQARTTELLHSNEALRAQIRERELAEQQVRQQVEENRKLEEQVLRSQRMESLGALAGGIAHDLNNALVPVIMGAEMLREQARPPEERQQLLDLIASSGERCTAMVKQILSFAKGSRGPSPNVSVRHLLEELAKLARGTFPKNITLEHRAPQDLWSVQGNATELHQVLLNLCVNARDAMPQGGRLTLAAENVTVGPELLSRHPEAAPGPHLLLSVADTGLGIAPELQSRIFEPFFTTKAADKGTGLGLSTVTSIVKRHHGFLALRSQPGRGTQFQVYLPATTLAQAQPAEPGAAPLPVGHGELVLFADDEGSVLELAKSALENYGYRLVTASNGLEAVGCFELHQQEVKLVVMDTDMPYLDGLSALRRIREVAPRIPLLLASASSPDTELISKDGLSGMVRLLKPYGVEDLVREVAKALSHDTSGVH